MPKNWCFWTVVLEKTLESPLDCKEIQPVHPKGYQSWICSGRTDAEAETPILWPPDVKSWLIWKDPDAGKDWRQEEKGMTEDEMVGWHHWLNGHEFESTLGAGDGQGGLVCCVPHGQRERIQIPSQPYPAGARWLPNSTNSSPALRKRAGGLDYLGPLQMHPVYQPEPRSAGSRDSCMPLPSGQPRESPDLTTPGTHDCLWQWHVSGHLSPWHTKALEIAWLILDRLEAWEKWGCHQSPQNYGGFKQSMRCAHRAPRYPELRHRKFGAWPEGGVPPLCGRI